MPPAAAVELAPAKVNLCLHVTGRRADGYHELDSVVAFAEFGDTVRLAESEIGCFLQVFCDSMPRPEGDPAATVPLGIDNLAWRALSLGIGSRGGLPAGPAGVALSVVKRLPMGAGLGGGSSDAAAVLRALARLPDGEGDSGASEAVRLGADVPMCLDPRPWRARGIGERLDPVSLGCDLPALLVWPGRSVATPAVFQAFAGGRPAAAVRARGFGPGVPEASLARLRDEPVAALVTLRNDLTAAACRVEPLVATAIHATGGLAGCRLARMSGSGSAVFGLFDDEAAASAAAIVLQSRWPAWWVRPTILRAGRVATRLDSRVGTIPPIPAAQAGV